MATARERLERLTAAAERHELLAAGFGLALIASLWFWPLFTGDQLGQSYALFGSHPWAATAPATDLPMRASALDAARQFQPWVAIARDQLEAGRLPLWNPYEYGGTTFVGNMQSALFFPLTWPLLVLPIGFAWGAMAVVKVVVAGLGTYALSRELGSGRLGGVLGGSVYMLSAPMLVWLQWPHSSVFALFPWLLLATTVLARRRTLGGSVAVGLVLALTILAGHPESALISVSAAAVYLIGLLAFERVSAEGRRAALLSSAAWVGAGLFGLALAAVAVVPFAQALDPSVTRLSHVSEEVYPKEPLASALQLLVPGLFGNGEPRIYGFFFYTHVASYFGLPAVLLALVALGRYRRSGTAQALAVIAALALMAAFGLPPLVWFLERVFPWSQSVFSERVFFVLALAGAVGAATGFTTLSRRPLALRRAALLAAALALAAGVGFALASLGHDLPAPASVKRNALAGAAALLLFGGAMIAILGRVRPASGFLLALAIVLVSLGGLQNFNVMLPPDQAYPSEPQAIQMLKRQPGPFRVAVLRASVLDSVLPPDTLVLYRLEGIEGFDYPLSKRWSDFETKVIGHVGGQAAEQRVAAGPPRPAGLTAMRMMNTQYYVAAPGARAPVTDFETVYRGPDATIFRDPQALPRAYVVPETLPLSYRQARALLARGELDPRRIALVPPGSPAPPSGGQPGLRPARVERLGNDRVRVHLARGSAGWLVLANAYAPTWRAEVDGHEAEVRPTNFAAMGVAVSASARTVDFRLDRTGFWLGAAISAAALAAVAALAGHALLRRRRKGPRGEPAC